MKIISYSDLHLEFGADFLPPNQGCADLMILAGDIITFRDYTPLDRFLSEWSKPVLFVAGNHEYYTHTPMRDEAARFQDYLAEHHPNVTFLRDESVSLDGVHFFGGTMWTDFDKVNVQAMLIAQRRISDYRCIRQTKDVALNPHDTTILHEAFVRKISAWFSEDLTGERVVISHHAPVVKPDSKHRDPHMTPAFNSTDMVAIIEQHQPALWVYGHTHECDDQIKGKTRIISNQLGYSSRSNQYGCENFDPRGLPVVVN